MNRNHTTIYFGRQDSKGFLSFLNSIPIETPSHKLGQREYITIDFLNEVLLVLAYQGKELTGYLAKKKTGNAINKHMKDGGMSKFSFHSSPRMIPHIFKPEVLFLKLSIPKFVPRGKSTKDVLPIQVPAFQNKLSDEEAILLAKYFEFTGQDLWRPSLIAFRHSQAFPSKVHRVMHSFRTGMLIDSMQHLQELCSPQDSEVSINEDENDQNLSIEVAASEPCERNKKGSCTEDAFKTEEAKDDFIHVESPSNKVTDISLRENSHVHLFLFGSEFLRVDDHGRVIVSPVAHLYPHETSNLKSSSTGRIFEKSILGTSRICDSDAQQPKVFDFCEKEFQSPDHKVTPEGKNIAEVQIAGTPDDEVDYNFGDIELSPRLTNLIKSGVVPESPIADGLFKNKGLHLTDELVSTPKESNEKTLGGGNTCGQNNEPSTPAERINKSSLIIIEDNQTPVARLSSTSCSKDWYLGSSTEKSESAGRKHKFRRLLKLGDLPRRKPSHKQNSAGHSGNARHINRKEGEKRKPNNVGDFIEEEAEVSSEVSVSDDEDDKHEDNSSYDDSFIDDRINPTAAADSQAETGEIDMLAIYRRSLLTQSPMPDLSINYTPHSEVPSSSQPDERSSSANGVQHNSAETKPACSLTENDCKLEGRKRKLSSYQTASLPVVNLQNEFSHHSKAAGEAVDPFDDDLFFQNIDLDAVEEEAARILRERSHNLMLNAPSFDLGI